MINIKNSKIIIFFLGFVTVALSIATIFVYSADSSNQQFEDSSVSECRYYSCSHKVENGQVVPGFCPNGYNSPTDICNKGIPYTPPTQPKATCSQEQRNRCVDGIACTNHLYTAAFNETSCSCSCNLKPTAPVALCPSAGATRCNGNTAELCPSTSVGWQVSKQCTGTEVCQSGKCVAQAAPARCPSAGATQCVGNTVQICPHPSTGWKVDKTCTGNEVCQSGKCVPTVAQCSYQGATRCNGNTAEICPSISAGWQVSKQCTSNEVCQSGKCVPTVAKCSYQGANRCNTNNTAVETCYSSAGWQTSTKCKSDETCHDNQCKKINAKTVDPNTCHHKDTFSLGTTCTTGYKTTSDGCPSNYMRCVSTTNTIAKPDTCLPEIDFLTNKITCPSGYKTSREGCSTHQSNAQLKCIINKNTPIVNLNTCYLKTDFDDRANVCPHKSNETTQGCKTGEIQCIEATAKCAPKEMRCVDGNEQICTITEGFTGTGKKCGVSTTGIATPVSTNQTNSNSTPISRALDRIASPVQDKDKKLAIVTQVNVCFNPDESRCSQTLIQTINQEVCGNKHFCVENLVSTKVNETVRERFQADDLKSFVESSVCPVESNCENIGETVLFGGVDRRISECTCQTYVSSTFSACKSNNIKRFVCETTMLSSLDNSTPVGAACRSRLGTVCESTSNAKNKNICSNTYSACAYNPVQGTSEGLCCSKNISNFSNISDNTRVNNLTTGIFYGTKVVERDSACDVQGSNCINIFKENAPDKLDVSTNTNILLVRNQDNNLELIGQNNTSSSIIAHTDVFTTFTKTQDKLFTIYDNLCAEYNNNTYQDRAVNCPNRLNARHGQLIIQVDNEVYIISVPNSTFNEVQTIVQEIIDEASYAEGTEFKIAFMGTNSEVDFSNTSLHNRP